MKNVKLILDKFKLSPSDVENLKHEARLAAVGYGKQNPGNDLTSNTWDLFDEISDHIWCSKRPYSEKIEIGFEFYDLFPSYYHFLVPFYHIVRNREIESSAPQNIIWEKLMAYLDSEEHYADPVEYVLWVEFFEDQKTVEETWRGLLRNSNNKPSGLKRLVECAGPVPFSLKEPLYANLLNDKKSHPSIFKSLLGSAFDLYGQVEKSKAEALLMKLEVSNDSYEYIKLKEKLTRKQT